MPTSYGVRMSDLASLSGLPIRRHRIFTMRSSGRLSALWSAWGCGIRGRWQEIPVKSPDHQLALAKETIPGTLRGKTIMAEEFFTPRVGTTRTPLAGLDKAQALVSGAAECLEAAECLDGSGKPDQTGEYIVLFHAIELGLKAFFLKH